MALRAHRLRARLALAPPRERRVGPPPHRRGPPTRARLRRGGIPPYPLRSGGGHEPSPLPGSPGLVATDSVGARDLAHAGDARPSPVRARPVHGAIQPGGLGPGPARAAADAAVI